MLLVLVVILPIQRLTRDTNRMKVGTSELVAGRAFLVLLMAFTVLPFVSIFTTALHPSGTVPVGLGWPAQPHWENFAKAFEVANMTTLLGIEHVHRRRRRARSP